MEGTIRQVQLTPKGLAIGVVLCAERPISSGEVASEMASRGIIQTDDEVHALLDEATANAEGIRALPDDAYEALESDAFPTGLDRDAFGLLLDVIMEAMR